MTHPRLRFHYGWAVLAMGTLVVFGALGLARFGYTPLLPPMQASLGLDDTQAGMLATANLLGYLALSAIGGALAARHGARLTVTIGLVLAGAGMVLTGSARGFLSAALWRALTGVGSGASNVAVMGMWAAWFSARKRGLASGIAVTGSSVALILTGPFVSRLLSLGGQDGWRVCWFIFGGLTLLLAIGAFLVLRNRPSEMGLWPVGEASGHAPPPVPQTEAFHWRRVYRSSRVWALGLVYTAFGLSYIIYMTFFVKRLIADGGYSQAAAGKLFMVMGGFSLFCGLTWGGISDIIGRKRSLTIVYLIHAVSFSLFALWPAPFGFTLSAVLFGLSAWSIPAITAAACGDVLGPGLAPAALGFITLFFGVGQAVGPSLAGAMADASGSFGPAFLLAGGIAFLGAIGSALLGADSAGRRGSQADHATDRAQDGHAG